MVQYNQQQQHQNLIPHTYTFFEKLNHSCGYIRNTGGPLDMRILGLVKTRISGISHSENQKLVIPYVHDFSLICEIKITFAAVCLHINY